MSRPAGYRHTEETKQRMRESQKVPLAERIAADAEKLRLLGPVSKFEFAEKVGCGEQAARNRLEQTRKAGLSERYKMPGMMAYTYVASVAPGATAPTQDRGLTRASVVSADSCDPRDLVGHARFARDPVHSRDHVQAQAEDRLPVGRSRTRS